MVNILNKFNRSAGKRAKLMDWILNEIRLGRLKSGDTAPTRFSLAKTFNCSRATADYVIKNLIQDNILVAEQGKGTFVASRRDGSLIDAIALINCNPLFSWSSEIEQGFLQGVGNNARVDRFSGNDIRLPSNWEACKSHKSLVFIMPETHHASFLEDLRLSRVPHLVLYRDFPESSFINIDHRAAGRAIVAALKAKGCCRLAWVSRTESRYKTPEERYAGFLEGLLEQGLAFRKEWSGFFLQHQEADYLRSLFSGPEKPDALLLAHASMGQAIKAIQEAGLVPGKDIQIAQMDEMEPGQYPFSILCAEKLTTRIGQEAARLLLQGEWPTKKPLQRFLTPDIVEH